VSTAAQQKLSPKSKKQRFSTAVVPEAPLGFRMWFAAKSQPTDEFTPSMVG